MILRNLKFRVHFEYNITERCTEKDTFYDILFERSKDGKSLPVKKSEDFHVIISVLLFTPMAKLPTEVTYAIVDFLWDEKPTLSACSLVCRSWHHNAQQHLFKSLRLSYKRLNPLSELQLTDPSTRPASVLKYLRHISF